VCEGLATSLRQGGPADEPLDALLEATGARATGLWFVRETALELRAFRAVAGMAQEVQDDFASATARVSLESAGLGIVKAALTREPTVAYLGTGALEGSGGWLRRFGAVQSLALPVIEGGEVVAVLAISAAEEFGSNSRLWRWVDQLAAAIAPAVRHALESS
jgi:hypothetical protein